MSDNNHVGNGGPAAWVARVLAAADGTPCRARKLRADTARILVVSPSMFVRMALVQRLSDVVSPNVSLVLAEGLADAPAEAYDLMVVGPYLSDDERAQALLFHAAQAGSALIELADSDAAFPPNESVRIERPGHGRLETLTRTVCAALSTPPNNPSSGGTDA